MTSRANNYLAKAKGQITGNALAILLNPEDQCNLVINLAKVTRLCKLSQLAPRQREDERQLC